MNPSAMIRFITGEGTVLTKGDLNRNLFPWILSEEKEHGNFTGGTCSGDAHSTICSAIQCRIILAMAPIKTVVIPTRGIPGS